LHSKGELFAFVTWKQQQDKKWFGAIVPAELKTRYAGKPGQGYLYFKAKALCFALRSFNEEILRPPDEKV